MSALDTYIKHGASQNSQALVNEAQGLETLRHALPSHAPIRVVGVRKVSRDQLHLEKIYTSPPQFNDFKKLAQGLVMLHENTKSSFGLEYSNFIGLGPQSNSFSKTWGDFFYQQRLIFQVERLPWKKEKEEILTILEKKKKLIAHFIQDHSPVPRLIHGDLWSGNVLFDKSGPILIDPAISFSDSECDLAMTKLFGGFPESFYTEYRSVMRWKAPLEESLLHKIYNLYHLLNHANIFGSSYLRKCHETLELINDL